MLESLRVPRRVAAVLTAAELARIVDLEGVPFPDSAAAILLTDDDGRYLGASTAALDILGYSLDELLELSVSDR